MMAKAGHSDDQLMPVLVDSATQRESTSCQCYISAAHDDFACRCDTGAARCGGPALQGSRIYGSW